MCTLDRALRSETRGRTDERIELALRLIADARAAGITLKCLGGIGCWLHIAEQGDPALAFKREYHDVNVVVSRKQRRAIGERLTAAGLRPAESFNAVQGETRLMFADGATGTVIDVFLGVFSMCHEVILNDEAFTPAQHPSLDLVELCLTKLQVVECNEKDLRDVAGLLAFHEFGPGPERLDGGRLSDRLARDWGLWRTVTGNLERVDGYAHTLPEHGDVIGRRVTGLLERIDAAPKSMRWRARARVGDRVPWYETPNEPDTVPAQVR